MVLLEALDNYMPPMKWLLGQFLNGSYCSFEDGECGWQPIAAKGTSWRRVRTLPKRVRFWMCSGGGQRWALSLWLVENSTGPEEQRRLWHSASGPKTERGWRLIMLPLYGLVDWFWLQFSTENGPGPGSSICLDNISFSMDCFLACESFIDIPQHTEFVI
ncbi:unnamed protein product [Coregonus sp. 'balchen']|nr:unnamed protein product [Coregonus sp. 'balchen']